jgi:rfaE bifunctional protein kinase chain/domain
MNSERFRTIAARYPSLRVAVLGDFCLDRYLEIDPTRQETSLETGLPVYNVTNVRSQPGGAGTVLNNLVALGVGNILPLGFAGKDGEGFELVRALEAMPGVRMCPFLTTPSRRTFTYCKPLLMTPEEPSSGKDGAVVKSKTPPRELNRLDSKNWTPTPHEVEDHLIRELNQRADQIDALILMDQVDVAETGVLTQRVLAAVGELAKRRPELRILADSRRGLRGYPEVCFKMNRNELGSLLGGVPPSDLEHVKSAAVELAHRQGRDVVVTLAEDGLLGATPDGELAHFSCLPVRGEIDIVGAGDCVTANLTAALAAGATLGEALQLANAAASVVIHQLGTTGSASVEQIAETLGI